MYRKQFKIPEAHQNFIEQSLDEWLKLGVVKRANSLYNSPIFCVPKTRPRPSSHSRLQRTKQPFPHRQILYERNHRMHRWYWKSKFYHFFNLGPDVWFLANAEKSQPLTAFTIPGQGQYQWITSPMGLLGCPASFQWLMEGVLRNISNVIVYIDDLLVHTNTHEDHVKVLEQVLQHLHSHNLKNFR